jgi:hypothetical protein
LGVSSAVISLFRGLHISHEMHTLAVPCLPVHMHKHGSHWMDFCEIWYWELL